MASSRVFSGIRTLLRMTAEQLISFARGAPSLDIVDVAGLKAAAARAFDADPAGVTAYGTSVGYLPLRKWIAEKHGVDADQVIVTNGSLEADAFVFEHLVKPGDAVIVEKPTYDRTLLNLRNRGAEVHQVTLDADGIDVDELRALLESGVRPTLAHIIPNFQNPAGVTLSAERRTTLLALAAEYGFTIFEDDPYADIRFRGERLPNMLSQDTQRCRGARELVHEDGVPGRPGRLPGRPEAVHRRDRQARDQPLHLAGHGLRGDRAPVLRRPATSTGRSRRCAPRSASGRRVLAESLRKHIPGVRFTEPDGGYFLWIDLPDDVDVDKAAAGRGRTWRRGRQGQRLPARGWAALAASGLLGGHGRPDRRGCAAARRGDRRGPRLGGSVDPPRPGPKVAKL